MEKPKEIEKIAKSPTKGRVKLIYALPYQECMVYLMQTDDLFHSFSVIKGQMYHFYLEMTPPEGKKSLSKKDIEKVVQILLAGAHTTIDQQMGVAVNNKEIAQAEEVMRVAEEAWGEKTDRVIN